jgi:hypothetical protein
MISSKIFSRVMSWAVTAVLACLIGIAMAIVYLVFISLF